MPGVTTVNEGSGTVTVAATSTEIAARWDPRRAIIITNDSDEVMYLALGEAAVANQGIRLDPVDADAHLPSTIEIRGFVGAINGICSSGSKVAVYVEY